MLYYGHSNKDNINLPLDEMIFVGEGLSHISDTVPMKFYYV